MEKNMDISEIRSQYSELCEDNDWNVFHTPKNLASALSVSSAKLLEHFQWITEEESLSLARIPDRKIRLGEELANSFFHLLTLSQKLGINLESVIEEKLSHDEATYQGIPDDFVIDEK